MFTNISARFQPRLHSLVDRTANPLVIEFEFPSGIFHGLHALPRVWKARRKRDLRISHLQGTQTAFITTISESNALRSSGARKWIIVFVVPENMGRTVVLQKILKESLVWASKTARYVLEPSPETVMQCWTKCFLRELDTAIRYLSCSSSCVALRLVDGVRL